jgi:hypothetical protein
MASEPSLSLARVLEPRAIPAAGRMGTQGQESGTGQRERRKGADGTAQRTARAPISSRVRTSTACTTTSLRGTSVESDGRTVKGSCLALPGSRSNGWLGAKATIDSSAEKTSTLQWARARERARADGAAAASAERGRERRRMGVA